MTAVVFGVHYRWSPPPELLAQLELADQLHADLTSLQLQYDTDLKAIWSSFPEVSQAEAALAAAEATAAVLLADSSDRALQGPRRFGSTSVDSRATARAELKRARQLRRDAITAVKDAASHARRDRTAQLDAARRGLYAKYCQRKVGPALYWATFNEVLRQHKDAVKRVARRRAAGQPATLRCRQRDGRMIAVQLPRRAGQSLRTPAVVADPSGRLTNVLFVPWPPMHVWDAMSRSEQRSAGRFIVRMRCGSIDNLPKWIEIPVQAHRMFPANADVVDAQLRIYATPNGTRAKLSIRARIVDPTPAKSQMAVALHLGWRRTAMGTAVASWRSTSALSVTDDLRDVVLAEHPTSGRIILPQRITDAASSADQARSQRAQLLNDIRRDLCRFLERYGPVEHVESKHRELSAKVVAEWRTRNEFAALALAWRTNPPPGGETISAALEAWRRADKKLWISGDYGRRRRASAARDDVYRRIAALVATQAGTVVVDDMNLRALAELAVSSAEPASVPKAKARRRRQLASPGRLRMAVTAAATREGCRVLIVPARGLSSVHIECGYDNAPQLEESVEAGRYRCGGCRATYDPNDNAVATLLHHANEEAADRG